MLRVRLQAAAGELSRASREANHGVPSIFPPTLPPVGAMMAVLVPTSSPFEFTTPPELPGLMAASVRP